MTTLSASPGTVRTMDGGVWDRLRRVDHRIWDALLALAVLAPSMLAYALQGSGGTSTNAEPDALGALLVVAACVPLAWRRRAPLVVVAAVGAAVAASSFQRVQLFGGTLVAGPKPDGGFVVRARLPAPAEGAS
jgi:hypothetical protein